MSSPSGTPLEADERDRNSEHVVDDRAALAAEVEVLEAEVERLRRDLAEAHRTHHRRAALGLAALGVLAIGGGLLFPVARTVLLALGGTGLFAALLTYYLTPGRFVSADVGERIYDSLAVDHDALVTELGLQDEHLYLPVGTPDHPAARLFIPQHADYTLPDEEALDDVFVVTDDERRRGTAFEPTGRALVEELRETTTGEFGTTPETVAAQLADGLVEVFELAGGATADVDSEGGRVSVAVTDSAYGPVDRFDHPVGSVVATGLATALQEPVTLDVQALDNDRADYLVTCRWEVDES